MNRGGGGGGLYDDIRLDEQVENLEFKAKFERLEHEHAAVVGELAAARARVAALETATATLERNACAIYTTAKQELTRKDAIVADLQSELEKKTVALARARHQAQDQRQR
jgi:hypothetical protein